MLRIIFLQFIAIQIMAQTHIEIISTPKSMPTYDGKKVGFYKEFDNSNYKQVWESVDELSSQKQRLCTIKNQRINFLYSGKFVWRKDFYLNNSIHDRSFIYNTITKKLKASVCFDQSTSRVVPHESGSDAHSIETICGKSYEYDQSGKVKRVIENEIKCNIECTGIVELIEEGRYEVISDKLTLYASPNPNSKIILVLKNKDIVTVQSQKSNLKDITPDNIWWVKIIYNDHIGYAICVNLKKID